MSAITFKLDGKLDRLQVLDAIKQRLSDRPELIVTGMSANYDEYEDRGSEWDVMIECIGEVRQARGKKWA